MEKNYMLILQISPFVSNRGGNIWNDRESKFKQFYNNWNIFGWTVPLSKIVQKKTAEERLWNGWKWEGKISHSELNSITAWTVNTQETHNIYSITENKKERSVSKNCGLCIKQSDGVNEWG